MLVVVAAYWSMWRAGCVAVPARPPSLGSSPRRSSSRGRPSLPRSPQDLLLHLPFFLHLIFLALTPSHSASLLLASPLHFLSLIIFRSFASSLCFFAFRPPLPSSSSFVFDSSPQILKTLSFLASASPPHLSSSPSTATCPSPNPAGTVLHTGESTCPS